MEKYEKDGQIAVLVSPGFGAGWSTWADDEHKAIAAMDRRLVEAFMSGGQEAVSAMATTLMTNDFYAGGARDLRIEWVPKGAVFEIEEYDGSESLHVIGTRAYLTA